MPAPTPERLGRQLKLIDVYAFSTGAMFSSGFFLLPGLAFAQAGPWMILAYALSALMVVPAMLSKAELCSAMPMAGGTYYFLDRSMGPLVGTIGGLGTWVAMGLKNTFALIGIGAYLSLVVDADITTVGLILAGTFTAVNVFGAKETASLQRWLVYALVGILALFLIAGFGHISGAGMVASIQRTFATAPGSDVDGVLATVGLVFVSYAGLTKVTGIAEEIEHPDKNILRGMVWSLSTAVFVYVTGAFVLVMVLDHASLATDLAPIASAAAVVFDWMPGRVGVYLIVVAALAAFASTANAGIMSASRYLLAMGRDRLIGTPFSRLGRFGTPTLAVLATGGFTAVALCTLDVVSVAKLASAFQLLMFAFVNLAVIVMRESEIGAYDPPVRSPFYPWMQVLGIFLSLGLIIEMGRLSMLFSLALVGLCMAWFFFYAKPRVERRGAILHWFERLGRERFIELEHELRGILKELADPNDDAFDALVEAATVIELPGAGGFEDVARQAAEHLAKLVPLDTDEITAEFCAGMQTGLIPVAKGAALPHFRVEGLEGHHMVIVRARHGVGVHVGEGHHSGERHLTVRALFFLISPDAEPGRHLRILAKLAGFIEHSHFESHWVQAATEDELRGLLQGEALGQLAAQLGPTRTVPASRRPGTDKPDPE